MDVRIPHGMDPHTRVEIVAREKAYSQQLQRAGKWPQIWRVAGEYSNFSIFDVESNDELHALISALPLFPYMNIHVTPLAVHPSDIKSGTDEHQAPSADTPTGVHGASPVDPSRRHY